MDHPSVVLRETETINPLPTMKTPSFLRSIINRGEIATLSIPAWDDSLCRYVISGSEIYWSFVY